MLFSFSFFFPKERKKEKQNSKIMASGLLDLLDLDPEALPRAPPEAGAHENALFIANYLAHVSTLPLAALVADEGQALAQASQSVLLALQALAARSYKAILRASDRLATLGPSLACVAEKARQLQHDAVPALEESAGRFFLAQAHAGKTTATVAVATAAAGDKAAAAAAAAAAPPPPPDKNELLARRRKAMLLARNADRVLDVLELPTLMSSTIASSSSAAAAAAAAANVPSALGSAAAAAAATAPATTAATAGGGGGASAFGTAGYSSALDLYAHIRRLHHLYPQSRLVSAVTAQAEDAIQQMTANIIGNLRAPSLKLPAAMRMIGWLRRVAPELDDDGSMGSSSSSSNSTIGGGSSRSGSHIQGREGGLGALFLVCRLDNLMSLLEALEPLRELADQESSLPHTKKEKKTTDKDRSRAGATTPAWLSGQHTERYLKRYIEIFREQSFSIISMYRSIFPASAASPLTVPTATTTTTATTTATTTTTTARRQADSATPFPSGDPRLAGLSSPSPSSSTAPPDRADAADDALLQPLPSALSTFPLHLVDLLRATLTAYLPNVRDRAARESLLTQVLYCAGSLARLGADFGLILATLGPPPLPARNSGGGAAGVVVGERKTHNNYDPDNNDADAGEEDDDDDDDTGNDDDDEDEDGLAEWADFMKKHRALAGRLDLLASGLAAGRGGHSHSSDALMSGARKGAAAAAG